MMNRRLSNRRISEAGGDTLAKALDDPETRLVPLVSSGLDAFDEDRDELFAFFYSDFNFAWLHKFHP